MFLYDRLDWHTDPVEARLPAEFMGPGGTEVIVWPERLIQGRNEVEQSLPAALVTQRILPILTALPQPEWEGEKMQRKISEQLVSSIVSENNN